MAARRSKPCSVPRKSSGANCDCNWCNIDKAWGSRIKTQASAKLFFAHETSHQFARDPVRDRAMPGRPAENFGGGRAAHAAVGAERERRLLAAPGFDRRFGRPGLRRAETKLYGDGLDHLSQRFLAAFDIDEAAGARFADRQRIKHRDIGDMYIGPAVEAAADIACDAG